MAFYVVRRLLALLLLLLLVGPGTLLREARPPRHDDLTIRFIPLAHPSREALASLGPLELTGAWRVESLHSDFAGWSGLEALGDGTMLAVGDRGALLHFSPPDGPTIVPWIRKFGIRGKRWSYDAEGITRDPVTGRIWVSWEASNGFSRYDRDMELEAIEAPPVMADWGANLGPEAILRQQDGSFVVLREGFTGWLEDSKHIGLLFTQDPTRSEDHVTFAFAGPKNFSPTEMAQLPDGRILVLMRRLVWPMPARFAGRLVMIDPRDIHPGATVTGPVVARLTSTLPVDNFEGMTAVVQADGKVDIWLISDDNGAVSQATILWKLTLDPARLSPRRAHAKGAQSEFARP